MSREVAKNMTKMTKVDCLSEVKQQFPIFTKQAQLGNPFHYLDNAASAHKPQSVIDAITNSYSEFYAPISRGVYPLAETASEQYEAARQTIAQFIGTNSQQLAFTKSATESLNMVAEYAIKPILQAGDEVWVSEAEHHSNYLPWQRICASSKASLRILKLDDSGKLILPSLSDLQNAKVKCIALSLISNVLGHYADAADLADLFTRAKSLGIFTVVDATQAISIHSVDVETISCDFLAFSGHKMFGPTGIGVLYIAQCAGHLIEPMLVGGGMVEWVGEHYRENVWSPGVNALEAGSPNFTGAIGLAAATEFIQSLDAIKVRQHIAQLAVNCGHAIKQEPGFIVFGDECNWRSGIVAFAHDSVHPHDIAQICAQHGVAIRAGHHCAQPLMNALGHVATARASFSVYNDAHDLEALISSLRAAQALFS